jgi:hypothetical protein
LSAQILFLPDSGIFQIFSVHDVVSLEDRSGPMAAYHHGYSLRNAGANLDPADDALMIPDYFRKIPLG